MKRTQTQKKPHVKKAGDIKLVLSATNVLLILNFI